MGTHTHAHYICMYVYFTYINIHTIDYTEGNSDPRNNIDEPLRHHAKVKTRHGNTQNQIRYDSTYMRSLEESNSCQRKVE